MRRLRLWGLALLAALAALAAYMRLAPIDPGRWHADLAAPGFTPEGAAFCPEAGSRDVIAGGLDAIARVAETWPRTRLIAGSLEEGRMTWVTRSRIFGFPDFTTAQIVRKGGEDMVCLAARQGYGAADFGVNPHRLGAWLMTAQGLPEPPPLRWLE
jgi:hypothetical protein